MYFLKVEKAIFWATFIVITQAFFIHLLSANVKTVERIESDWKDEKI